MSTEAPPIQGTPPPVAPNFSDWRKPDGTINHESFKALPEDIRHVGESLTKYKTDTDLFRGIANLQTLAGKKGLIPLAADAPKEAVAERKALLDSINGVPPSPKDYKVEWPDFIPEGQRNAKLVESTTAWAHKWSVSNAALKELTDGNFAIAKSNLDEQATYEANFYRDQQAAFDAQIKQENIPADRAASLVERGATQLGLDIKDPETQLLLKSSKARLMALRHAMATGEDTFVAGGGSERNGGDPEGQASDIMHNKANPLYAPLYDTKHPQHRMAKEKVDGLLRVAVQMKQKAAGGAR